jgi:hypothetical protein
MMKIKVMVTKKQRVKAGYILLCGMFLMPSIASAQSSSPNYRVEESFFGTGGEVDTTSPNYRARQSTGSLGVGNSSSANYSVASGFDTPSEPFLEVAITGPDTDMGVVAPTAASYASPQGGDCNCSFYVRSYLSSTYSVVTASRPPTNESGDEMNAKSVTGAPSTDDSIEEFGINMVANTVPGNFGQNPTNSPDNSFADGKAATGYSTPNQFKYGVGDTIASSPATPTNPGVGRTNYTISYIMKSSNITPAGKYVIKHDLIIVPTF